MTKEEIKQNFDKLADISFKHFTSEIRGCLYHIKTVWNWSNEDLAYFLGTTVERIENMLSEDWDGKISSLRLAKLQLLSIGQFGLPGCELNDTMRDSMSEVIGDYKTLNTPVKTYEEKVQDVLDLFGVTDDDSLDRLINAIINVRSAIDEADKCNCKQDCKQDCKCDNTDSNTNCNIQGSYYDSNTMDKPETFNFDFNKMTNENIQRIIKLFGPSFANVLKKLSK